MTKVFLGLICLLLSFLLFQGKNTLLLSVQKKLESSHDFKKMQLDTLGYLTKHIEALKFCNKKGLNKSWCILADMGRHSGAYRLLIWNLVDSFIDYSFLVSHGCGNKPWGMDLSKKKGKFSNVPESHCSSLGKYRIGKRGVSQWGIKVNYLLHGLDSSNNNALKRTIVLHSWEAISDQEIYPAGTPEGWGCPAVSNRSMGVLDSLIQSAKRPVLMWQFVQ